MPITDTINTDASRPLPLRSFRRERQKQKKGGPHLEEICNTSSLSMSPHHLLLFSISTTHALKTTPTSIPNCPSFDCGDGVEIVYPFWVPNKYTDSPSFCGYPLFKVTCDGDNRPSFHASSGNYTVRAIDSTTHTLSLVDTDVVGLDCPRPRRNFSTDGEPLLGFADSTTRLTFFFNCTSYEGPRIPQEYHVECLENATGPSYVYYGEHPPKEYDGLYGTCTGGIVASPVLHRELRDADLSTVFRHALSGGFELTWKETETAACASCERSGGYCGYDDVGGDDGLKFKCFCKDGSRYRGYCSGSGMNMELKIGIGIGAFTITLAFLVTMLCVSKYRTKWMTSHFFDDKSMEAFLKSQQSLAAKRYGYYEVKKMTASFNEKLGQGGYGTVYKGKLLDGTLVAVKLLRDTKGSGEEFINEVSSISRTNHISVVSLLGFCSEGSKRALIYEFMPNGSLDKFLFADDPKSTLLGWEKLHNIAVGIARGLEYLHRGCTTHIIHFDIKPHNILLDEDLCPKISDFGLAKLYKPKESIISMACARGTIGYIAPEVFSRSFGLVSSKSDVYSYGMMILEIVGQRRNVQNEVENASELYIPHWIYEHLDQCYNLRDCADSTESEIARKMTLVGLWCIQTNPSFRPSVTKVIEMLEGNVKDLEVPPKPYVFSSENSRCNSDDIYLALTPSAG